MDRTAQIAAGLEAGLSQEAIGATFDPPISGPAVSQAISRSPRLRRMRSQLTQGELWRIRAMQTELRAMARDINRMLRELKEEEESYLVDQINGLR